MIISLRTMTSWLLLSSLWLCMPRVFAQTEPFDVPLEQLKRKDPENVVRFVVEKAFGSNAVVKLETRGGFKIYDKGLEFHNTIGTKETDSALSFVADPIAQVIQDPFYNEKRAVHSSGAQFKVQWGTVKPATFSVRFEACSVDMCLLPTWFKLQFLDGTRGVRIKKSAGDSPNTAAIEAIGENSGSGQVSKVSKDSESFGSFEPVKKNDEYSGTLVAKDTPSKVPLTAIAADDGSSVASSVSLTDRASLFVQNSLSNRSWWLFPALLLAGLLMNLTPCVYPMIPITLNVLSTFGVERKGDHHLEIAHNRKWLPFLYVLGMVLSYTLMGVGAGMTGTLFGSLLQSVYVAAGLAVVMFLLGLSMLGVFNMTTVQNFATKIPIAKKYPTVGVITMGALSGLVSAPCTGPVLSMILLLIGKSKDPVYGFVLMAFFSFGFGAPYIFLGLFTQKLGRLPKVGMLLNGVKTLFAALMFGLALYYIKPLVSSVPEVQIVFAKPSSTLVVAVILGVVIFELVEKLKPTFKKITQFLSLIAATALALWFTLFITSGFVMTKKSVSLNSPIITSDHVVWESKWEVAVIRAATEQKPLLVDLWAEWCAACVKMDSTVWSDPGVVKMVDESFVALKIDFTRSTPFTEMLTEKWEISGLPAVGFYRTGESKDAAPQKLFREAVTLESFYATAKEILDQKEDIK